MLCSGQLRCVSLAQPNTDCRHCMGIAVEAEPTPLAEGIATYFYDDDYSGESLQSLSPGVVPHEIWNTAKGVLVIVRRLDGGGEAKVWVNDINWLTDETEHFEWGVWTTDQGTIEGWSPTLGGRWPVVIELSKVVYDQLFFNGVQSLVAIYGGEQ